MLNCNSTGSEKQTVTGIKHWALQLKAEAYLEDLDVDGEMVIKWIVTECQDVNRVRLAQNTNHACAQINTALLITACQSGACSSHLEFIKQVMIKGYFTHEER